MSGPEGTGAGPVDTTAANPGGVKPVDAPGADAGGARPVDTTGALPATDDAGRAAAAEEAERAAAGDRPRGLLIDFGGVLTSNVFEAFGDFAAAEGLERDAVADLFRTDREARGLLKDLESGAIDTAAFGPPFAAKAGLAPERAEGIVTRMFSALRPDEAMGAAVRAARAAGIRTGLISNSWGDGMVYDDALLAEAFDAVVLSHEVRLRKPAPEIFTIGAERIGLPPEACVFVDDLPFNLPPAEALGMQTVLHRSAEETVPALEALFGVPLR
ncbi:HAD-IA family hydrolase [Patulibacter americanus]|uniref:HAD-IA family hydrolase n=1 Tax=Patulibacter americanus TaxID=588672 RepID=UPI0003B67F34|nr:HAD-IA family hydrolase [Patulibacter americanus]